MTCSKCPKDAVHHITVRRNEPEPEHGQRDARGLRIVRFCGRCWSELEKLLPAA
jgi:hypothetical protein